MICTKFYSVSLAKNALLAHRQSFKLVRNIFFLIYTVNKGEPITSNFVEIGHILMLGEAIAVCHQGFLYIQSCFICGVHDYERFV